MSKFHQAVVAVSMAIIVFAAVQVRASIIIDENFDGTAGSAPSATDWDYTGAVTLDGAGNAVFDSTGGFQQLVGKFSGPANQAYAPVGTNFGQVTFSNITGNVLYNGFLGLSGAGQRIWLRTDLGNGLWTVDINNGGAFTYRPTDVSRTAAGTWVIQWFTNQIVIYHNGVLKFNSLTDVPTAGDPAWSIPLGAARPDIGGSGGQIMNLDRIIWIQGMGNQSPIAGTNEAGASHGQTIAIPVFKLLANDSDPDGDVISITGVSALSALGASVSLSGGIVTYNAPLSGTSDSFTYTLTDICGGATIGTVNITLMSGGSSGFNQLTPEVLPGGAVKLNFLGIPGLQYVLEWTHELNGVWTPVLTNQAANNGFIYFTNTPSVPGPDFYRTRYLQ